MVEPVVVGIASNVDQLVSSGNKVACTQIALKADKVGTEETFDDVRAPRKSLEQLERWERDVVEPSDGDIGP